MFKLQKILKKLSFLALASGARVARFATNGIPLPQSVLRIYSPPQMRSLVTTHMVVRMAIMQLHIAFADLELTAAVKCLSASKAIIAAFKVLYDEQPETADYALFAEPFVLVRML